MVEPWQVEHSAMCLDILHAAAWLTLAWTSGSLIYRESATGTPGQEPRVQKFPLTIMQAH